MKNILLTLLFALPGFCFAGNSYNTDPIEVAIILDNGRTLTNFPVAGNARTNKAYLVAEPESNYSIEIKNHTPNRIGVVVAVDGRNIISGKKSHLASNERMYILNPYERQLYRGWRTARNEIHRFYFTSSQESYAAAWGDESAMGVIAAAVYREQPAKTTHSLTQSPASPHSLREQSADSQAGTGFGASEYSKVRQVKFVAQSAPEKRYLFKYEWREALCEKGIISCQRYPQSPWNRFWKEDWVGYAPYPPNYRRQW